MLRLLFLTAFLVAGFPSPRTACSEPVFGSDFVFPPKSHGRPHGASIVETDNGKLLATWFSAKEETDSDAEIYGSIHDPVTAKWSAPFTIVPKTYTKSVGNTALFRDDGGLIWMFFAAVRFGGWSGAMVDYTQSRDGGLTWSEGKNLVAWPGNLPRNPPVRVGPDEMLVPLFVDFWYEAGLVGSYTALIKHKDGVPLEKTFASLDDSDAIQPTAVKLADGRFLLLMRDKTDKFIRRSWSKDNGRTWSPVTATTLPNPGAGICAMYVEEAGVVLVAYNHSRKGRNPLSLAVSGDGGETFRKIADLESRPGDTTASFDYPAMTRSKNGMIHIVWTHDNRATLKRVWFNVEWLKEKMGKTR
ncbi:MAG: exo-alpha-sialidase [Nitrospinae bacterium]|nr:exo-alpha-sialidase [Nitrospinota bacterium]